MRGRGRGSGGRGRGRGRGRKLRVLTTTCSSHYSHPRSALCYVVSVRRGGRDECRGRMHIASLTGVTVWLVEAVKGNSSLADLRGEINRPDTKK